MNEALSVSPVPLTKLNVWVFDVSGSPALNVVIVVPVAVPSDCDNNVGVKPVGA